MANPPPEVAALYRSDPRMAHAVFEIEPRVRTGRILLAGSQSSKLLSARPRSVNYDV
jgi:hypothetical protein